MNEPPSGLPPECAYAQCQQPAAADSVLCAEHAAPFDDRYVATRRHGGMTPGQWAATFGGIGAVIVGVITIAVLHGRDSSASQGSAGVGLHHRAPPVHYAPVDVSSSAVYLVSGTAQAADITYSAGSGTEQQQDVPVPVKDRASGTLGIRFEVEPGTFLYLSAQNRGGGSLTCEIMVDGSVVDRHTSYGRYAVVSCQGTA